MKNTKRYIFFALLMHFSNITFSQQKGTDVTTTLHTLQPNYSVSYYLPATVSIAAVLKKIQGYLVAAIPAQLIARKYPKPVTDFSNADTNIPWQQENFRLTSYKWEVTYSSMMLAGEDTGDTTLNTYTKGRISLLAIAVPVFSMLYASNPKVRNPLGQVMNLHALDDADAVCAAKFKILIAGGSLSLRTVIDNYIDYISTKQFRLVDRSLEKKPSSKKYYLGR
ncbi:MAG TPA: hypothetical protein VM888_04265 [Chitinophagaceae bacterium]|nr:hypothetical protein [Chitinophagaceae bacterium]